MRSIIISVATLMVALSVFASNNSVATTKMTPEERKAYHNRMAMEKHGGFVTAKGTPIGSIVVVNSQTKVSPDNFDVAKYPACNWLTGLVKIVSGNPVSVETASAERQRLNADFAIFIIDDKNLPVSLIAVEAQWAILNIGAMAVSGANDEIVRIRSRNEFSRVFSILCGGFCSQYPAPLMNMVTDLTDLDKCLADPPGDVLIRVKGYLEKRGVKPERKVLYRKAVQEGWASPPTNDYQRAVWKQVHAIPDKPITIEFDPAKDK